MTLPPDCRPAKKSKSAPAPASGPPKPPVHPSAILVDPLMEQAVEPLLEETSSILPGQPVSNPFLAAEIKTVLADTLWHGAVRNDTAVAKAISEGSELDGVYTLEDAAALDEFLTFLHQAELFKHIETLAQRLPVERLNVPPLQYILLYLAKTLMGIPNIAQMSPCLLSDPAYMALLGFNAHQIENGVTRRGDSARGPETPREGPVSSEAVADNIVKLDLVALEAFFNGLIQDVVKLCIRTRKVNAVADTSDYETTESFQGAGHARRERKVAVKDSSRTTPKMEVTVWGWKVGVLYHPTTGLPLAIKVATIETSDHEFTLDLIQTAQKNLGDKKLVSVSLDRGFIDGEAMWHIKNVLGIDFIIPARADLNIYTDACAIVEAWKSNPKQSSDIHPAERKEQQTTRDKAGKVVTRLHTTSTVGIEGLQTLDSYGPPGHQKRKNSKKFVPNSLNGVVVTHWRGQESSKPVVFLTSHPVSKPLYVYDRYDDRSTIENGTFRESKQHWSLQRPPQKNEAGVRVHVYLSLAGMALLRCFRLQTELPSPTPEELDAQDALEKAEDPAAGTTFTAKPPFQLGMQRYRQALKVKNRNKVIAFVDGCYGIFHVQELSILGGLRIRTPASSVGTRTEVFRRYGLEPPESRVT